MPKFIFHKRHSFDPEHEAVFCIVEHEDADSAHNVAEEILHDACTCCHPLPADILYPEGFNYRPLRAKDLQEFGQILEYANCNDAKEKRVYN